LNIQTKQNKNYGSGVVLRKTRPKTGKKSTPHTATDSTPTRPRPKLHLGRDPGNGCRRRRGSEGLDMFNFELIEYYIITD